MQTDNLKHESNNDQYGVISNKKLRVGMVIVPKPEHYERLSKCMLKLECIVTQYHVDNGGELGELWMIKQ